MHRFLKIFAVFSVGAICYGLIEISVRGFSHITMGFLGGISMTVIHLLNDSRRESTGGFTVWTAQLMISSAFITSAEFLFGEILNRQLDMNIWDYSRLPLNLDGQICIPFMIFWIALSAVGTFADDLMRWKMFGEPKNFNYLKQYRTGTA